MRYKTLLQNRLSDLKVELKRLKSDVGSKKLAANGTFGKLGSPYSAFYSPDLLLAVTLTGQLNLACLIYDIEFNPSIRVMSANTDGIMVKYPARFRDRILRVIGENAKRTGYEYEETAYKTVAMANVNNYLAICADRTPAIITPDGVTDGHASPGKVKRKGLYAKTSLMKNPTNEVCSNMAADYLKTGILPEDAIENYTDIKDFVATRAVKGGGIQYDSFVEVDDWVCVKDLGTKDNEWRREAWEDGRVVKRKSRPAPVLVGVGGEAFGRIARWYMQKDGAMPINYVGSGNRVPKTEGAKLCMTLPASLPADLDKEWYIRETYSILSDLGVEAIAKSALSQIFVSDDVTV